MSKKMLDMRTLYILYEEATKNLRDPTNTTELLKVLQTIQDAANLDSVLGIDEEALCININPIYNSRPAKETEQIIKNLSYFIENVNEHKFGWKTLEPRTGPKIAAFLDGAKRFATELLHTILRKKRALEEERTKTTSMHRLPSLQDIKHQKKEITEERMNTIDSLLAVLGFGKRDRKD